MSTMSTQAPILTVAVLSTFPSVSFSWLSRAPITSTTTTHQWSSGTQIAAETSHPGVFFGPEEEFECPDEEECEIDWERMPGFDENEPQEVVGTPNNIETESMVEEYTNIGDEDPTDDLQPQSYEHKVANSVQKSRLLMEMSWQIDECKVDRDSCADFCPECAGSGRQLCKFCRGTRTVVFGNEFRTCLICEPDGKVECSACRGTGGVAPWVATHGQQSL
jgi:hypothetical protein